MTDLPVTPYAGTSGWSGSSTSREHAERNDSSGRTETRQSLALQELRRRGWHGATSAEVGAVLGIPHQSYSAVMSVLHKEGLVARLQDRRGGREIYVLPQYVGDRPTSPYLPNRGGRSAVLAIREIKRLMEHDVTGILTIQELQDVLDREGL